MDKEANVTKKPFLERAYIFLETQNWKKATEYFEKTLDLEPQNAEAYLGKLLAELKLSKKEDLKKSQSKIDSQENYILSLKFADTDLRNYLIGCSDEINNRLLNKKQETKKNRKEVAIIAWILLSILIIMTIPTLLLTFVIIPHRDYKNAGELFDEGKYEEALKVYQSLGNFSDAEERAKECNDILDRQAWVTVGNLVFKVPRRSKSEVIVSGNTITLKRWSTSINDFLSLVDPVEGWSFDGKTRRFLLKNERYARCYDYNSNFYEYLDLEFVKYSKTWSLCWLRKSGERIDGYDIYDVDYSPRGYRGIDRSLFPSFYEERKFSKEKNVFSCDIYNEADSGKVIHYEFTVIIESEK